MDWYVVAVFENGTMTDEFIVLLGITTEFCAYIFAVKRNTKKPALNGERIK